MHGIYIAAILTSSIAIAVFGTLIHKLRMPANEKLLWLAAAIALPMQPLAFYLVRMPLDHWLKEHMDVTSLAYQWLTSLYAPLTEEPAKLVPLLIPAICRDIRRENFVRYALAIGLGFAIGEMWFVAERVARLSEFAGVPFYQFGGYVVERLMTCVFHSAFVAATLWQLRRRLALGLAGAMALHWLGNMPIMLMQLNVGGLGKPVWSLIVQLWLWFYLAFAAALLSYFTFDRFALGRMLYGRRQCPECQGEYDGPILALNFGPSRYERCPHCRHWHWTKAAESKGPAN